MAAIDELLAAEPRQRLLGFADLTVEEQAAIDSILTAELENPWYRYHADPVAFVTEGIEESVWSKQIEILESVRDHKRTAVPACHAPGKSHLAARVVAWWIASHAPGTAIAVTTAPTNRQVRNILWPHIRRVGNKNKLPGQILTVTWKLAGDIVAYGFSPNPTDESAVQGIHAPNLLIVVDEAGGIGEIVGQAMESVLTGGNTRLLLLGNPPTDQEDSWFERCCSSDLYNVIPISAYDTPNFTGEPVSLCKSCPEYLGDHYITDHLVDRAWVDDVLSEFGEDSPFAQARVFARFPRVTANKVVPFDWADMAVNNDEPGEGQVVRLGCDIAADGGDEFVVARADGFTVTIEHRSAGQANASPIDVAQRILQQIHAAEKLHEERGIEERVRVKIDSIGVGWGVVGILESWGREGRHHSLIVPVNVAERSNDPEKFHNQRAEMWWNIRQLIQPDADGGRQLLRLDVDRRTVAQLTGPTYRSDSAGRVQIEKKTELKRRGAPSPDRAEAVLLALFEPNIRDLAPPVMGVLLAQENQWANL